MDFVQIADDYYRVVYRHYRVPEADMIFATKQRVPPARPYHKRGKNRSNWRPYGAGGATEALLFKVEPTETDWVRDESGRIKGEFVTSALAVCSISDQFNYKRGRDIALGRALKNLRTGG